MPLTCVACALKFNSTESQREHYRLEWHRANLKRKVAGLPPISKEEYDRRKAAALEMQNQGQKEAFQGECVACKKKFSSRQIMSDHLRSKKHIQRNKAWEKKQLKQEASLQTLESLPTHEPIPTAEDTAGQADFPPPPPPNETQATPIQARCPGNHEMAFTPASEPLACDECAGCFGEGVPMFSCRECEYDVCGSCRGQGTELESEGSDEHNDLLQKMAATSLNHGDASAPEGENEDMEESELKLAPLLVDSCLFCSYGSRKVPEETGIEACLNHMLKEHGFFIPDIEYLTDVQGLLMYLQEKVKRGMVCLYCHKQPTSLQAVQSHMKSKAHCKLLYDPDVDMEEYEPFYDFSASYKEAPEGLVSTLTEKAGQSNSNSDSDSDLDSMSDSDDEERNESTKAVTFGKMFQTNSIGELVLLDGRVVGNRQYRRYYRQNFRPEDDRVSVVAQARENRQRLLLEYGFAPEGAQEVADLPKNARTAIMRSQNQASKFEPNKQIKQKKKFYFDQSKQWMRLGTHNNKLQKFGLRVQDM